VRLLGSARAGERRRPSSRRTLGHVGHEGRLCERRLQRGAAVVHLARGEDLEGLRGRLGARGARGGPLRDRPSPTDSTTCAAPHASVTNLGAAQRAPPAISIVVKHVVLLESRVVLHDGAIVRAARGVIAPSPRVSAHCSCTPLVRPLDGHTRAEDCLRIVRVVLRAASSAAWARRGAHLCVGEVRTLLGVVARHVSPCRPWPPKIAWRGVRDDTSARTRLRQ
jgi:hypothetical protein